MATFKKTYTIDVEIDLDACHWDGEWGVEDFECGGGLGDFLGQLREDLDDYIKKNKEA